MALTKEDKEYIQMTMHMAIDPIQRTTDENATKIDELYRLIKGENGTPGLFTQVILMRENCARREAVYPTVTQPRKDETPKGSMQKLKDFLLDKIIFVVLATFGLSLIQMILEWMAANNIHIIK